MAKGTQRACTCVREVSAGEVGEGGGALSEPSDEMLRAEEDSLSRRRSARASTGQVACEQRIHPDKLDAIRVQT